MSKQLTLSAFLSIMMMVGFIASSHNAPAGFVVGGASSPVVAQVQL